MEPPEGVLLPRLPLTKFIEPPVLSAEMLGMFCAPDPPSYAWELPLLILLNG